MVVISPKAIHFPRLFLFDMDVARVKKSKNKKGEKLYFSFLTHRHSIHFSASTHAQSESSFSFHIRIWFICFPLFHFFSTSQLQKNLLFFFFFLTKFISRKVGFFCYCFYSSSPPFLSLLYCLLHSVLSPFVGFFHCIFQCLEFIYLTTTMDNGIWKFLSFPFSVIFFFNRQGQCKKMLTENFMCVFGRQSILVNCYSYLCLNMEVKNFLKAHFTSIRKTILLTIAF